MGVTASIQKYPSAAATNFTSISTPVRVPAANIYNVQSMSFVSSTSTTYTTSANHNIQAQSYFYVMGARASAGNININSSPMLATAVTANTVTTTSTTGTALTHTANTGILQLAYGQPYFLKFVNNKWIMGTDYGCVLSSDDGISWTVGQFAAAAGSSGVNPIDVSFGNGVYVFVTDGDSRVYTSTDLVSFTPRSAGVGNTKLAVEWIPSINLFVTAGDQGEVLTSPDGITWTSRFSAAGEVSRQLISNGTTFVVNVPGANKVYYSTNGTSWTSVSIGSGWVPNYLWWDTISSRWNWNITGTRGFADADITRGFASNTNDIPAIADGTPISAVNNSASISSSQTHGRQFRYYRPTGLHTVNFPSPFTGYVEISRSTAFTGTVVSNTQGGTGVYYPSTVYRVPHALGAASNMNTSGTWFQVNSAGTQALIVSTPLDSTRQSSTMLATIVTFQ